MTLPTRDPITPSGCRWCGICQRWINGHGWHKWEQPTSRQILARMKARRLSRPTRPDPHAGCFEPHLTADGYADCDGQPL